MRAEAGLLDEDRRKGFVKVENFQGKTATFDLEQMEQVRLFLKRLKNMGMTRVMIGLDDNSPIKIHENNI